MIFLRKNSKLLRFVCTTEMLLLLSLPLISRTTSGSSFYIKNEYLIESNIFEDSTETQALGSQLWFGLSHHYLSNRQTLSLKLVSNLAYYNQHPTENKSVNMLTIQYRYSFLHKLSFQTALDIYNKQWYQNNNGYTSNRGNSGFAYVGQKNTLFIGGEYQYHRFPHFKYFTSDYSGLFAQFQHSLSERSFLVLKSFWHSIRYADRVIAYTPGADSLNLPYQKDEMITCQIGIEKRKNPIMGLQLRYMINRSNSPGSSFQAGACRFFTSQKIMGIYTHLIVDLQLKKYTENLDRVVILSNPDPEQNIQNQILLGWDKPLNKHFSIQGKIAYIHNETVYSRIFYDKCFAAIGLMYTLH